MATCATTSPLPKTRRDRGCAEPLWRKAGAGADTNAKNRYGVTPLSLAARNGSASMLDLLLRIAPTCGPPMQLPPTGKRC